MARQYLKQKRGQMVTIHGFEEMVEALEQMEKTGVEQIARKVFDECCDVIRSSMDEYASASLPADLANKQTEFKTKEGNVFLYAYGFDRNKDPEAFLKACYLNYGTPRRQTESGANRGRIEPRYFISNAKRSAAKKLKSKQKKIMEELAEGLKNGR